MRNKTVVITGGTDGMGAAVAIALYQLGAHVIIIGRSKEKADVLIEQANKLSSVGSLEAIIADFSLMKNVISTATKLTEKVAHIDILFHAVGILITHTEFTSEGIEKDFAISYLSRFVFTEELFKNSRIKNDTIMLNISASAPKIPSYAQMEFSDLQVVKSRTGMKSHGQAQLANDLYTAIAAKRYSITTIGYGPGSVDTNIRREIPKIVQLLMKPFFYFSTRKAADVAKQLVTILSDVTLKNGTSHYYNKSGQFTIADFIADPKRQNDLLNVSLELYDNILKNTK